MKGRSPVSVAKREVVRPAALNHRSLSAVRTVSPRRHPLQGLWISVTAIGWRATPMRCNRTGCETIVKKRFVQKTRVDQRSM